VKSRYPSAPVVVFVFLVAVMMVPRVSAGESKTDDSFDQKHQVGVRLGVWANGGETPPKTFEIPEFSYRVDTDISSANVYLEGYAAYRLYSMGLLEFSVGFANRGDVNVQDGGREYFGNLILYPIMLQLKNYLPMPGASKFRPYVTVGGGIYYGRNSVQFTNDAYYAYTEESETDFNYVLGGGIDYQVAGSIALEMNAKYMPINFSKNLILVQDYQAFTITFGVKYLFAGSGE